MHTTPPPEIASADLKAVRDFLTAGRDQPRPVERGPRPSHTPGPVTLRNGITRARRRAAAAVEGRA